MTPAQAIAASRPPQRASASATAAASAPASLTSACHAATCPSAAPARATCPSAPAAPADPATSAAALTTAASSAALASGYGTDESSATPSTASTRHPSAASARTVAAPMPRAAPVTSATRPAVTTAGPGLARCDPAYQVRHCLPIRHRLPRRGPRHHGREAVGHAVTGRPAARSLPAGSGRTHGPACFESAIRPRRPDAARSTPGPARGPALNSPRQPRQPRQIRQPPHAPDASDRRRDAARSRCPWPRGRPRRSRVRTQDRARPAAGR